MGTLSSGSEYYITFRMLFPYDVFEPEIDCENFGAITINTANNWEERDNVFFVGRD